MTTTTRRLYPVPRGLYFNDEEWDKLRDLAFAAGRIGVAAYICKIVLGYTEEQLAASGRRFKKGIVEEKAVFEGTPKEVAKAARKATSKEKK